MFRPRFKLFLWYFVILLFVRSGEVVFLFQFLLCKITLLHFTDDEVNVLQSVKHLAAFGWGHRKIPEQKMDGILSQKTSRGKVYPTWFGGDFFLLVVVIRCCHCDSMLFIVQDGCLLNYFVCYTLCVSIGLLDWFQRQTEKNKSEFSSFFYFPLWWDFSLKREDGFMKVHLD